jgi:hypothetical protein
MNLAQLVSSYSWLLKPLVALVSALLAFIGVKKGVRLVSKKRIALKNTKGNAIQIGGDVHASEVKQVNSRVDKTE